jgi:hypothetical protein
MIFDILEAKLIAAGFVPGVEVFRNYMPAECSIGVMTRIPLQGLPIDPHIRNYYRGQIQVITRHKDPVEGNTMTHRVQRLLTLERREHHPGNSERGDVHLDLFWPETLPISFPRLNGNGFEWSQHFRCVFGMKPL